MNQTRKIRWLIAHEPVELFLRTARAFSDKLSELTNNEYEVEIFTAKEYEERIKNDKLMTVFEKLSKQNTGVYKVDPMVAMEAGELEMSQLHITELAKWHSPDFFALEMPFLFRDHDHAARVLEGTIGQGLLDNLKDTSPAQGLAFTYSGGFRVVVSKEPLLTLEDFKGITFATATNPVTVDTVEAVGAVPESFHIRDFVQIANTEGFDSSALETTIPRYLAQFKDSTKKYLVNTKHNLFLTSIIVSNTFWASLDADTQAKFQAASMYASRLERQWSVEEAEEFAVESDKHAELGITYSELNTEETEKFKQLVQPLYDKYKDFFYPGLIDGIIRS